MVTIMAKSITTDTAVDSFYSALVETARLQNLINKGQQAINDRKASISQTLMELAKDECNGDKQEFLKRCATAEVLYKASGKAKQLPKQWTQAKSNIKGAMELDFDLQLYTTESSLRKEVGEKRKAIKAAKAEAAKLESATWADVTSAQVADLLHTLEQKGRADIAQGIVNDAVDALTALTQAVDIEHGEVVEGEVVESHVA